MLFLAQQSYDQADYDAAWDYFQKLIDLDASFGPAWAMLGNIALVAAESELALSYFRSAIALGEAGVWLSVGQLWREQRELEQACKAYTRYLDVYPDDADAWLLLAQCYRSRYWTAHEAQCLERAQILRPDDRLLRSQALTRFYAADWDWLKSYFTQVLDPKKISQAEPERVRLQSLDYLRYLFTDPQIEDPELFRWMKVCHRSEPKTDFVDLAKSWPERQPGPLRLGYLSSEFGSFASVQLVWPLYFYHSPAVEMRIYDDTPPEQALADPPWRVPWRRIYGLDDQRVAELMQEDQLDVLIDLTGISHQTRHGLYALHPAPAQVSGLGFVFSSGLACMDYCFTDPVLCPPHIEALYPEQAVHLSTAFHWQPPEFFTLTDPPSVQNGYITLGAAHTLNRLHPAVIALWASILHALPHSRLFLKTVVLEDPKTQAEFYQRFAELGVSSDRLRLEGVGPSLHVPYFYPQIDIALDPFPYSGGVTTSEALWMGVPVAVMDQPQWRSRALSVSLYHSLNLTDWLAHSEDEYLERVVSWAQNPAFLKTQRQTLRDRLLHSPICDGPLYAREVEAAYWAMRTAVRIS